jgi:hypothetical protein
MSKHETFPMAIRSPSSPQIPLQSFATLTSGFHRPCRAFFLEIKTSFTDSPEGAKRCQVAAAALLRIFMGLAQPPLSSVQRHGSSAVSERCADTSFAGISSKHANGLAAAIECVWQTDAFA